MVNLIFQERDLIESIVGQGVLATEFCDRAMNGLLNFLKTSNDVLSIIDVLSRDPNLEDLKPRASERILKQREVFFIPMMLHLLSGEVLVSLVSADGFPCLVSDIFSSAENHSLSGPSNNCIWKALFDVGPNSIRDVGHGVPSEFICILQIVSDVLSYPATLCR